MGFARRRVPRQRGLARRSSKSEGGHGLRSAKREGARLYVRGFTLVELIAVIAIIAILAALVVGLIVFAARRAAIADTRALLQRLSLGINMYHGDWGDYPPDARVKGGWTSNWSFHDAHHIDELTMPSETLWFFLNGMFTATVSPGSSKLAIDDDELARLPRKSPYMEFKEGELKHVGIEFWRWHGKDFDDLVRSKDNIPEIVDAWDYPIHYVAKDRLNDFDPEVNVDSFDLVSRGPDRLTYGTEYQDPDKEENRDNITNFSYD